MRIIEDWLSCKLACTSIFSSQIDRHAWKLPEGLIHDFQLVAMNDLFSLFHCLPHTGQKESEIMRKVDRKKGLAKCGHQTLLALSIERDQRRTVATLVPPSNLSTHTSAICRYVCLCLNVFQSKCSRVTFWLEGGLSHSHSGGNSFKPWKNIKKKKRWHSKAASECVSQRSDDSHSAGEMCSHHKGKMEECLGGNCSILLSQCAPPLALFSHLLHL